MISEIRRKFQTFDQQCIFTFLPRILLPMESYPLSCKHNVFASCLLTAVFAVLSSPTFLAQMQMVWCVWALIWMALHAHIPIRARRGGSASGADRWSSRLHIHSTTEELQIHLTHLQQIKSMRFNISHV